MSFCRSIFVFVILTISAVVNVSAQMGFWDVENDVTKMLLKKPLQQAVKESENSSANDLKSLLWRLTLYRRAANYEKVAVTVRQLIVHPDFIKKYYQTGDFVQSAIRSSYFQDAATLRFYLEKVGYSDEIYSKLTELCKQNTATCDVEEFDRWLAQKSSEAENSTAGNSSGKYEWLGRRIDWRKRFGLDYKELSNRFIEDVRKDPADLETALRYLNYFNTSADLLWLAQNFSSPQAYSYYELGKRIGGEPWDFRLMDSSPDEAQQSRRVAIGFLLKSLETPFNEKDVSLIYAYKLRYASVPPKIGNYDKQLRFWTKQALAENYKNINEPQNAQPIVEELMKLDKSDILSENPAYLAGAVQDASGARVVESEILRQQAERQDSYRYWQERILYYYGRNEPELMFSSYMQSFSAVPFDPSNENSAGNRIFYLRHFAEFSNNKFGQNANKPESEDWSLEDKRRNKFWKDTENFLRTEFEKTKSNIKYSYALSQIIKESDFDNLSNEILSKNPEILTNAAKNGLFNSSDRLLSVFLKNENIPQAKKDVIFNELIKIADNTDIKAAWSIFEALLIEEAGSYAVRMVPIFEKHLEKSREFVKTYKPSEDDDADFKNLPNKYADCLFRIYLAANDRKSAEKLLLNNNYSIDYGLKALIVNAVRNKAFDEALRYWKMKANFNRQDLEDLSYLRNFPALAQNLRDFYGQMKKDEPYSPVPDAALQILK